MITLIVTVTGQYLTERLTDIARLPAVIFKTDNCSREIIKLRRNSDITDTTLIIASGLCVIIKEFQAFDFRTVCGNIVLSE